MNVRRWLWASLRFHRRSALALLCGAALTAAILTGAWSVGDSMRFTLATMAADRLGQVQFVLDPPGRHFSADLGARLSDRLQAPTATVLHTMAAASQPDSGLTAHQVQVYGVDADFWPLAAREPAAPPPQPTGDRIFVNETLAQALQLQPGQAIVLRMDKPGVMSRDAPLATVDDDSVAVRATVAGVLPAAHGGDFGLQADSTAPRNVFVDRAWLQALLDQPNAANRLLVGALPTATARRDNVAAAMPGSAHPGSTDLNRLQSALRLECRPSDLDLVLSPGPDHANTELTTRHVFLSPAAVAAARSLQPPPREFLTYFVNRLELGSRSTPYSLVTALEPSDPIHAPATTSALPPDLDDQGIAINAWLAADLKAQLGDRITLHYYVMGLRRQLIEQHAEFTLRAILPMNDPWCDRSLMPAYPGIADSENCRDWKPGIPIDMQKIRDLDETYWDDYRGTPKAFITLAAGSKLWNNRFGDRTALRWPATAPQAVADALHERLDPALFGLQPRPVADAARTASRTGTDFGGLFIGLSFFLVVAALILVALLYRFQLQTRTEEIGVLLALGLPRRQVQRLLLCEAALTAAVGAALGAGLGLLYTRLLVWGLNHGWQGAVNTAQVQFAWNGATLVWSWALSTAAGLAAVIPALRERFRQPVRALLNPGADLPPAAYAGLHGRPASLASPSRLAQTLAAAAALTAGLWAALTWHSAADPTAAFMGIGALLLTAGLLWQAASLRRRGVAGDPASLRGLTGLARRNAGLRWGRSLAAIAMIACGCFLVVAIGSSRQNPALGAAERQGGAGGFSLYMETSLPLFFDLNTPAGRDAHGLDTAALQSADIVPLRVHAGDDASCLNLNRAQSPRLLGLQPAEFDRRGAFQFLRLAPGLDPAHPWLGLTAPPGDNDPVPAIGDEATVYWALGKQVGDTLDLPDGRGGRLQLILVGMLRNSILQGSLLIDESALLRHFPAESGYRLFLVDASPETTPQVRKALAAGLKNAGPEIVTGAERLQRFHTVEETYLAIFALLGGWAMALGSLGLGLVLMRNALERRAELALLRALGFTVAAVRRLLWLEFGGLMLTGWCIGVTAALAGVAPSLVRHAGDLPLGELTGLLGLLLACGFGSIAWAAHRAVQGPLLSALQQE